MASPAWAAETASKIRHVVVVIQENHSFDSYFGRYCRAKTGSNPACKTGPECCEAGPDHDPGTGIAPTLLSDEQNAGYDPNHSQGCELVEIDGGKMDRFVNNPECGNPSNFAYADATSAAGYWAMARDGALADRYFQPIAGASSSNNMYFARAQYVFTD
ncbi:MAG TPA: alkaline phosphatase family protein, partial [Bdellovibrionota bacterium]|nr:alkaline phosphatase family protein [Bdellovibrionota bacterium]